MVAVSRSPSTHMDQNSILIHGERVVSATGLKAVREYLARRMPLLADAPVTGDARLPV